MLNVQRYVLKVTAHDIDSSLVDLFDIHCDFNEQHERDKLLSYVHGFYPKCSSVGDEYGRGDGGDGEEVVVVSAQYQCDGERLFIATQDQALDVTFVDGKVMLMLWRRSIGAPIRKPELDLIRSFTLQFGGWLWHENMNDGH